MGFGLCDKASVTVSEIGEEEAEECVPAKHISNIIVAHHHKGKGANEKLISALGNESFYGIRKNGKKEKTVDPHYIVLIRYCICTQCLHGGEQNYLIGVFNA